LLLGLGIAGVILARNRKRRYPKASQYVGLAGMVLILRTLGLLIFGWLTGNQFHSQSVAVAGILVAVAIGILFSAAFAFPDDQAKRK